MYSSHVFGQCVGCPIVAVDVDLTASPNMEWLSPILPRAPEQCCAPPSATARCVRFNVYTHPDAQMLNFEIYEGASPPGHSYSLNCGGWVPMGTPVCLNGPGPHCVLVCKPGGNENSFRITQSRGADISPPITIGEGCQDTVWVTGLVPSTIQWNIVNPSPAYNSYLSATAGVEQVFVASPAASMGIPYFDIEVQGQINGVCAGAYFKDTVRVSLVSNKGVVIQPLDPVICYGGTSTTLTAEPYGGLPPYKYLWSNGATTQSISVSAGGDYSVTVSDATDCPVVQTSRTVRVFTSPITVDAGVGNVCTASPTIQLQGVVNQATGGIWSGGTGSFNTSNTDLNATYTLSPAEVLAKTATLTLTSTGNGGCPSAQDNVTITVSPLPFVNAGTDGMVCASTLSIPLQGAVWGDATQGVWHTLGTGSFVDASNLTGTYIPSAADISIGYVDLVLSSIANGLCAPVRDTVRILFGNEPTPNFTFPQPACSGQVIQFTDASTVGWGVIDTWNWDFGNGLTSLSKNPTSVYSTPGTYNVRLRVTSDKGCTTEITKNILISQDPVANFSASQTCLEQTTNFTDLSTNASAWTWVFNNGGSSTVQNPQGIQYLYAGQYNVSLTVTSPEGCKNSITKPITILPKPIAEFSVGTICIQNQVTFQQYSYVANDIITSWNWDLGNGTTSNQATPSTMYTTTTPTTVQLIVATATCSDTISKTVYPRALPILSPVNSSGCSPHNVHFTMPTEVNTVYAWNFGDGGFSSTANPQHIFTNNTSNQTIYTVKTVAQNSYSCIDSITSQITVFPLIEADFAMSATRICSEQQVDFVAQSPQAVAYNWNFGDGASSTVPNPSHTFINNSSQSVFYTVTLITTSAFGCKDTVVKYITVNPLPNLVLQLDKNAACHPATIQLQTQSGAQLYHWDFGDGTSTQGSNNMTHVFNNKGITDKVYAVLLTVTSMHGCVKTFSSNVTVYASPIADFSITPDRGCAPLNVQVQNNSYNVLNYTWSYGDGEISNQIFTQNSHIYANSGTSQQEFVLRLDVESASGCTHFVEKKVFVYPQVIADFVATPMAGCSPFVVQFTNQSINADSHSWMLESGINSALPSPSHVFINQDFVSKQYPIKYIARSGYGCSDTSIQNITVKPLVQADFSMSKSKICSNEQVTFTAQTINAVSYAWDFGNGQTSVLQNPTQIFVNTGATSIFLPVQLIVTSVDNCSDTIIKYVTVHPIPAFPIQLSKATSCSPAIVMLTTPAGAQLYNWDFGDGTSTFGSEQIQHSFVNTSTNDITYTIQLEITTLQGCTTQAQTQILLYASPVADFDVVKQSECAPVRVDILNNSFNTAIVSWSFGDGGVSYSTAQTLQHIYENVSQNEIKYELNLYVESANGCTDILSKEVSVYPLLQVNVTPSKTSGCSPVRIDFTNTSVGVDFNSWDFGNSKKSYDRAPSHVFFNDSYATQNYEITYIGSSIYGCADTVTFPIQVNPLVYADFTLSTSEICSGETVSFQNTSINGTQLSWNFGNGQTATIPNPSMKFENTGTMTVYIPVTLSVASADECSDSIVKYITVNPLPSNQLQFNTKEACHPANITMQTASGGKTYYWDFGDGTFQYGAQSMTHTYINETTVNKKYIITLNFTSNKGCVGTFTDSVTIFPSPQAMYVTNTQIGCSPLEVTFTNQSQGAESNYWRMLGDTVLNNSLQVTQTFTNNGTTQISFPTSLLVVSANGCSSQHEVVINVFPPLQANFVPSSTTGCSPMQINFENTSTGASTYIWHYGDGNTSTNINTQHVYMHNQPTSQIYQVYVVARSAYNCIDTSSIIPITIHPSPQSSFVLSTIAGCSPLSILVTNTSKGATSYLWNFDDGVISDLQTIGTYKYKNTSDSVEKRMMTLSAFNEFGCVDTSIQPISVFPEIMPEFSMPQEGCSPFAVEFTNTSKNSTSYVWDFGNGQQSSIAEPEVYFVNSETNDKIYTISLLAHSNLGCSGTASQSILVHPAPKPDFSTSASYLRIPESTVGVTNLTEGTWEYMWTFGDGAKTDEKHPVSHTYNKPGEYQIILKASSPYCWDTISHFVTIAGARVYADYDSSMYGCVPLTVTFTNKSRNAEWYVWNFGNGDTSTAVNPTYTYTEPGTYVVELTAGNEDVKDVSRAHTISVYTAPKADFEIAPEYSYLPNAMITTYNKSKNGYSYVWYFGDGDTSHIYQPTHEYTKVGIYDIALAVTSREGCYDSLLIPQAAKVLLECKLLFPNAFTPIHENSDGYYNPELPETKNDIFHPVWQNIIEYNLQIFNRWGEIVFESNELDRGWNGYYKDILSKSDVYVWRAQATCWGGKKLSYKGNVTLLR